MFAAGLLLWANVHEQRHTEYVPQQAPLVENTFEFPVEICANGWPWTFYSRVDPSDFAIDTADVRLVRRFAHLNARTLDRAVLAANAACALAILIFVAAACEFLARERTGNRKEETGN